jgi:YebC/PmpR family DNA-binding regulatory protein
MAGHSKWANIKHKKDRADKQKGKVFSLISKEIINAVKQGGPDPKANSKLRLVIQKAKQANVPNENIERNIKKASDLSTANFHEITYELYGYGGVGILVDTMTDNKNRIASEIRIATNKRGGNVASPGSVAFNFDRKGIIQVPKKNAIEDELFMLATDAGAEDFEAMDEGFIITTKPEDLFLVKEKLDEAGVLSEASIEMIPKNEVKCSKEDFDSNMALIDWLDDIDDVDSIYHNMEEN